MPAAPDSAPPRWCDLHLHSNASDGTDEPADLPRLCKAAGLSAFALTDHDTVAGVAACAAAAKKQKIDFVPGIELSVDPDVDNTGEPAGTLHLLGLFIDPDHPWLGEITQALTRARAERNPEIIRKLSGLGVRIAYDEVLNLAGPGTTVGRPHIAQVLVKKGYVKSVHEAFAKYIGSGGAAYARRDLMTAKEAIKGVHAAGGLALLAHPVQLRLPDEDRPGEALAHVVGRLKAQGLDGLETRHSDHAPADVARFEALADRLNLLTTGGSDYHGSRKSIQLGHAAVPRGVYERLRDEARRRWGPGRVVAGRKP